MRFDFVGEIPYCGDLAGSFAYGLYGLGVYVGRPCRFTLFILVVDDCCDYVFVDFDGVIVG